MKIVQDITKHAETLGAKGKVDLARIALKLGKKLDQATVADEAKLKSLAQEIWGKSFQSV